METTVKSVTRIFIYFVLTCDLGFEMISKVKATKTFKIQSALLAFAKEFMKIPTTNYIVILAAVRFPKSSKYVQTPKKR